MASGAQETDIVGATSAAYTVTQGDVGVALKVKTTFNDEKGNRESLTSASTVLVIVAQVKVSFGAAAYAAAEGGPAVTVTVVLDKDPHRTVTIPLTATPEGGTGSGDYTAPTEVVFNAGATTKDVTVMAVDDTVDDDGESVVLTFGILPDGVSAGTTARALVQITDNDGPGVVPLSNFADRPRGRQRDLHSRIGLRADGRRYGDDNGPRGHGPDPDANHGDDDLYAVHLEHSADRDVERRTGLRRE